jgi:hypothetical protein
MPTSHGSQYFGMRSRPSISQGCTNTAAPRSRAASNTGEHLRVIEVHAVDVRADLDPASPSSRTQRSSSRTARSGVLHRHGAQADEAFRVRRDQPAMWSFSSFDRSSVSAGFAQ